MKVYSIAVFRKTASESPILLAVSADLSSFGFFQRSGVREVLMFVMRQVASRTANGSRQSVVHQGHVCHCAARSDGLVGAIVTDEEYPTRVAHQGVQQYARVFEVIFFFF
jgi:synaptobrevin family protein YKT6